MKPYNFITTLFLLLIAIATPSATFGQSTHDRQLQDSPQQTLFDEALATWTNLTSSFPNGLVDYNFAYLQNDEDLPRFHALVRNSANLTLDTIYPQRLDEMYYTIDDLMDYISGSLADSAKTVNVTYDKMYGYPTSWIVDLDNTKTINGVMHYFTFFSVLQRELSDNKAIWEAQEIDDSYDCTMQLIGFLPPAYTMPMSVEVRKGDIATVYYETGEVADPSMFNFPTIERAFATIEFALNNFYADVHVAFDPTLGFPTQYNLQDSIYIADGSSTYFISNVVAVGDDTGNTGSGTVIETPQVAWATAKSIWDSKGLANYRFGILRQCECLFSEPISIQVANGEVVQMTDRLGTEVFENVTGYSLTIEEVFDLIKDGMDSNFSSVVVTYDEEYGYPTSVSLDSNAMIADDEYTLTIDYLAPITEWQNDLEVGQGTWQEQNLASYHYTYQLSCGECPDEFQRAKLIQVVDGLVVAIDGSPVQAIQRSSSLSFDEAPTLERLFEVIQNAIDTNAFQLGVTYDEEYGYPTSIGIDYDEMMIDEELFLTAKLEKPTDDGTGGTAPEDAWANAKSTWESKGLVNYHFGIFKECRCAFTQPIAIQVSNGEVIEMRNRFGDQVFENVTGYSLTIEDVFDLIKNGLESNFSTVEATYDEEYGYPTNVVLDASAMTADDEYTLKIDYVAPLTEWQNDLEAGKTTWQAQNLTTYNYTYQQACECPDEFQTPKLIQVVDNVVVAIDGSPAEAIQQSYPTFDGLFAKIQDGINANAFRVSVTYDQQYGYPKSVGIDYDEMIADEEYFVTAKLEGAEDNGSGGVVDPDPFSSAPRFTTTLGRFGLSSMLLWMIW